MKTLFESPAKLVKYALTFVAFFVGLGIILTAFFGFNTSAEFGGHYELTIDCMDSEEVDNYYTEAKKILKEYGYSVSDYQLEDRLYCDTLVIRYASESETNANLIKADLARTLNIDENMVQVNALTLAYNGFGAWNIVLVGAILALVSFIIGMIIKGWNYGVGNAISYVASFILSMAIIGFTRITLSPTSLILVVVISAISLLAFAYISNIIYKEREDNANLNFKEAYLNGISKKYKELYILGIALALVGVVMLLTFNRTMAILGLTYLVSMLVMAFVSLILVPAIFVLIEDYKVNKLSKTMSRNNKK